MRFLYSIFIFWPLSGVNLALTFLCYRLFGWLNGKEGASRVSTNWGLYQYNLAFAKIKVEGLEHVPREGGAIIASNHRSYFDIFTICAVMPRDVRWVMKEALMRNPLFGFVLRHIRAVGLDRSSPREAIKILLETAKELKQGDVIAMFPEGTRSGSTELLPFKSGVFALALKAGVPVVPVLIEGSEKILPARKLIVNCFKEVRVKFLKPINPQEFGKDRQKMSDEIRSRIEAEITKS